MRRTMTSLSLGACLGWNSFAAAQVPFTDAPPPPLPNSPAAEAATVPPGDAAEPQFAPRRRMSFSDELIYERAAYRARQRLGRTETRKWLGISLARPDRQGHSGTIVNEPFLGPSPVPYGFYMTPIGARTSAR